MVVTAVEPRKKSLLAVFIDGEPVMLDKEVVLAECLHEGDELSLERLEGLKERSFKKRAREKALWLLSRRDYTEKELMKKLSEEAGEEIAAETVARMRELGLIDDERYARRYASDLVRFKSLSPKMVKLELARKGIDRELCDQVVEEIPFDAAESLEALIERKYRRQLDDEKGIRRTYAALARKGYAYDEIRTALRAYIEKEENFDDL